MKVVCNKKSPVVFKNVAIGTCFAPSNNAERIYLKIANELLPLMDEDGSYVTAIDVETMECEFVRGDQVIYPYEAEIHIL